MKMKWMTKISRYWKVYKQQFNKVDSNNAFLYWNLVLSGKAGEELWHDKNGSLREIESWPLCLRDAYRPKRWQEPFVEQSCPVVRYTSSLIFASYTPYLLLQLVYSFFQNHNYPLSISRLLWNTFNSFFIRFQLRYPCDSNILLIETFTKWFVLAGEYEWRNNIAKFGSEIVY